MYFCRIVFIVIWMRRNWVESLSNLEKDWKRAEKYHQEEWKKKRSNNKTFACAGEHITNKSHKNINNRHIKMVIINFRRRIIPNAFMSACVWLEIVFKFCRKKKTIFRKSKRKKKTQQHLKCHLTSFVCGCLFPFNYCCGYSRSIKPFHRVPHTNTASNR